MSTPQTLKASTLAIMAHNKRKEERIAQIAEEVAAIRADKARAKPKSFSDKRRVSERVVDEYEIHPESGEQVKSRRNVRKYVTTLDLLEDRKQLPKELRNAFDEWAKADSLSSGACIDEKDLRGSSSRGTVNMEGVSGGGFGPRTMSDQVLNAERKRQFILGHIPQDLMPLAMRLLHEETGVMREALSPLTEYGRKNGFNQEQQARSSGATMAIDICRIVHHALKQSL